MSDVQDATTKEYMMTKGLSNREAEVATIVAKGLSNKSIAALLYVTEKTIKFHLTNIFKKLGVKSRAQLIVYIAQNGPKVVPPAPVAEPVQDASLPTGDTQKAA